MGAHHEPIAKQVGARDQVIESIRSGRAPMGVPAKEGVFAQTAKEFTSEGSLTERTFQPILHILGPRHTVDLTSADRLLGLACKRDGNSGR